MSVPPPDELVGHIREAAEQACLYVEGLDKGDFFEDKRTQQAVILNLIILGEAATKLMDRYPAIADANPTIPWKSMRGMRNRIAQAITTSISMWCGTRYRQRCRNYWRDWLM